MAGHILIRFFLRHVVVIPLECKFTPSKEAAVAMIVVKGVSVGQETWTV